LSALAPLRHGNEKRAHCGNAWASRKTLITSRALPQGRAGQRSRRAKDRNHGCVRNGRRRVDTPDERTARAGKRAERRRSRRRGRSSPPRRQTYGPPSYFLCFTLDNSRSGKRRIRGRREKIDSFPVRQGGADEKFCGNVDGFRYPGWHLLRPVCRDRRAHRNVEKSRCKKSRPSRYGLITLSYARHVQGGAARHGSGPYWRVEICGKYKDSGRT